MLGGALEWKSQSDALKAARYTSRGEALKSLQRLDREGVMWEGGFKGSRMNDLGKGPRSTLKIENQKPKTTNRKRFIHLSSVVEVDAVRGCKVRLPIESMHQSCARVVARHGARHGAPAWCPGMVPGGAIHACHGVCLPHSAHDVYRPSCHMHLVDRVGWSDGRRQPHSLSRARRRRRYSPAQRTAATMPILARRTTAGVSW